MTVPYPRTLQADAGLASFVALAPVRRRRRLVFALAAASVSGALACGDSESPSGPRDAGVSSDLAPDSGPGAFDLGDGGRPDSGLEPRPDAGIPDAGPADGGDSDAGATEDGGQLDTGVADAGLQIVTAVIAPSDPCVARDQPIMANRQGGALTWELITDPSDLLRLSNSPAGPAPVRLSAGGILTLEPVYQRIPGFGVVGVRVTDPGLGETAEAGWEVIQEGIANYMVSLGGGPAVFRSVTMPPASRTSTSNYVVAVADRASLHPCAGVAYRVTANCAGGAPADVAFTLEANGELIATPMGLSQFPPGPHCVAAEAVIDDPPIVLDQRNLIFSLMP